jgi:hypothetical protein
MGLLFTPVSSLRRKTNLNIVVVILQDSELLGAGDTFWSSLKKKKQTEEKTEAKA